MDTEYFSRMFLPILDWEVLLLIPVTEGEGLAGGCGGKGGIGGRRGGGIWTGLGGGIWGDL
jgi:hypothetical protein